MGGGAYTSEAKSWRDTPPCAGRGGQDVLVALVPGWGEGEITSYRGIDVSWAH